MPDERPPWKLTPEALAAGAASADEGVALVLKAQEISEIAASGDGSIRHANGTLKPGALKSDAQDGWTRCISAPGTLQGHGRARTVDRDGNWARNGCCEWCFKENWTPERLAARGQEEAVAAAIAAEDAQVAALLAVERKERENAMREINARDAEEAALMADPEYAAELERMKERARQRRGATTP